MPTLYPDLCYNEVCYRGTALSAFSHMDLVARKPVFQVRDPIWINLSD